ncbi:Ecdysteroid UDP-glucosyltransferase [Papilio machaon]|uniref:UDP-glucuronosyltransferase n=1 Tax=Papilio machaon TaxID=76193 RepID=A0A194RKA9_PAPMA|nr:Ecdysteroid UDP-glucosyltransferase [Papilio machaon]
MKLSYKVILTYVCLLLFGIQCGGYKILAVFPIPAGSHKILGNGVVNHLLNAGHEVTYITPFPENKTVPNLRYIPVIDNIGHINDALINIKKLMNRDIEMDQEIVFNMMMNLTQNTLKNNNVSKLLNDPTENFDLVIAQWTFNEVFSGVAAAFNCPYIWFFPYEPSFVSLGLIDEATNPAYTANIEMRDIPPFTFWQRFKVLKFQISKIWRNYFYHRHIENEVFDNTFKPISRRKNKTLPPYEELRLNASLIFGNYHVSMGQAIRLPQNYIPIGGQHIDEVVPALPKDLKKIMDEATNGVIYFSMGSNLKSKDLPDSIKQALLKIFNDLNQTIIWKFEEPIPNLPKNVHILKWAPQLSILSHPNCILLISHGGLLSMNEAIHFGVPLISIPVFYDHLYNADKSVSRGIGVKVDLTDNLADDLKLAIHEMLNNPMYRERMKEASFIYHHRLAPPGKVLVHWVEHVIATRGALHLRSPALLIPWYQKMYLDLALLLFVGLVLISWILRKLYYFKSQYKVKAKLL